MDKLFRQAPLRISSFFLLLLVLWGGSVSLAHSQAEASVFLTPSTASVMINGANTVMIELLVTDAVNLQGYEFTFSYDPAVLHLQSSRIGSFLPSSMKLIEENTPGHLRLVILKLGPPGISGDGQLLKLTFSGVAIGTSDLTITQANFTHESGGMTDPQIANSAAITVAYDPALLPGVSLTGAVSLQGQAERSGVAVTLSPGTTYHIGPYTATSSGNTDENLAFGRVVTDTYTITTNHPRYLNITADLNKTVMVANDKTSIHPLWLRAGNAVWSDDVIDASDASLVGAWFGKTTADLAQGESLDADVNFDGVVNVRDLALVAGNYDLTAATAYGDWIP